MRRPSSNFSQNTQKPASNAGAGADGVAPLGAAAAPVTSQTSSSSAPGAPSNVSTSEAPQLLEWVSTHLPATYPRTTLSLPESFVSGEIIFSLVKSLSGVEPSPPVSPAAFEREADGQPGLGGLIAMMDMLVDAGVKIDGISINEVRVGDKNGVVRLLKSVQDWYESGQAGVQS